MGKYQNDKDLFNRPHGCMIAIIYLLLLYAAFEFAFQVAG